ncbi:MAG: M48 family metalloprotease [Candidatus Babeliales bacterium]
MINKLKNNFFSVLSALCFSTALILLIFLALENRLKQVIDYSFLTTISCTQTPQEFHNHVVDHLVTTSWHHIEAQIKITFNDCQDYVTEHEAIMKFMKEKSTREKKAQTSLSRQTAALIKEVLVDFNISPNSIDIIADNALESSAAADAYAIYINETNFNRYSYEAQRFIIAHEIAHFKNKDSSLHIALGDLSRMHFAYFDTKPCVTYLCHAHEHRADMDAMLKSLEYTKAGIMFFHEVLDRNGDNYCASHPRPSDRLKIAKMMEALYLKQQASSARGMA